MSCPSSAFAAGVIIGVGNASFSIKPSGNFSPHNSRLPNLYSRAACPAKYPRITISIRIGSHALPIATIGSGVATNQLGTIS